MLYNTCMLFYTLKLQSIFIMLGDIFMKFDRIGFIGLGLIGGSIAKKIRELYPDCEIIATAGHLETITEAYTQGIIVNHRLLPLESFSDCDIIFLCAPVQKNLEYLKQLKYIIRPDCYITDVGSTKSDIHKKVIDLDMEDHFIGGHPMTGSEKTGITNADPSILVNAYYIITPTAATPAEDIEAFEQFVTALGSIPLILDYNAHDHATASISHLPHIIAYSLVNLVKELDDENETMKRIAAGGFKDITRIASSSPVMWQNICISNKDQLLLLMDAYIQKLKEVRSFIQESDSSKLHAYFQSAKDYRDSITVPNSKRRSTIHEIYIDLDDKAGEIAVLASILGAKGISIRNIGIINNREFEKGVLRIEFYDSASVEHAIELLQSKNYKVYER